MKTLFIVALLLVTGMVSAEERSSFCEYGTYKKMLSGECECTKYFPKKEIPAEVSFVKGHKLVGVCGVGGTFQFRANVILDGVVEYSVGPAGAFYFHTNNGNVRGWLEAGSDDLQQVSKLKATDVNLVDGSSAKGKLKIREYYIQYEDGGVGRQGITKYDVVKIGKFRSPSEMSN